MKEHSPQLGCKWDHCGLDDEYNCEFNRYYGAIDVPQSLPFEKNIAEYYQPDHHCCRHEWRQLLRKQPDGLTPSGFYCIFCLQTADVSDNTIEPTLHNKRFYRGDHFLD